MTEAPLSEGECAALLSSLSDASGVVLAVSGGPDSTALMGAFAGRPDAWVATVDHGLRRGSRAEAEAVARRAAALGLPHRILAWEGPKPRAGLQAAARAARYGLLAAFAREVGASHVATAHTRDDQAETVLLRLAAGSGVAGLAGMRASSRLDGLVLARPFLDVPKARLVATCLARSWPFVDDPSNADPRFARARLRATRAALAAEGLSDARLATLARRAARADDALEAVSRDTFRRLRSAGALDGAGLLALPEAVALRVVARALAEAAPGPLPRLERLERLVLAELLPALAAGRPLRRTLGGALLQAANGRVTAAPAPPRRPP